MIGWRKAQEMILLGLSVDGKEAEKLGIATKSVPAEEVDAVVKLYCDQFKSLPPQMVGLAKTAMHKVWEMDVVAGCAYEIEATLMAFSAGLYTKILQKVMKGEERPEFEDWRRLTSGPEWRL